MIAVGAAIVVVAARTGRQRLVGRALGVVGDARFNSIARVCSGATHRADFEEDVGGTLRRKATAQLWHVTHAAGSATLVCARPQHVGRTQ